MKNIWCGLWNSEKCFSLDILEEEDREKYRELMDYSAKIREEANELVQQINGENFYEVLPQLMKFDAKLRIVSFFFSNKEIIEEYRCEELIELADSEYKKTHFDRLASFEIKPFEKDSLLFQIG
ncbi:hypothetical protein IW492_14250 [Enterococcus sp. BWB1-3]|uniref:DUF7006 family protein n=1 Tax=unclassified Enterococcus TaxID=2608891 RepID=UPI00192135F3|nr:MULTISPECIES: hypothetical protein [unclassified Enterococcus]MBL1230392.1 hypothetical protein [Enterococcus sp. BWB1-3]MCB5952351.1 hypothetical protein [Enterococcus sp. BWT-B8]